MKTDKLKDFFKSDKKYFVLVLICFLYAGVALISFTFTLYVGTISQSSNNIKDLATFDNNDFNFPNGFKEGGRGRTNPMNILFASSTLNFLVGGIVSLVSGLAIASLILKKSKKEITHKVTNNLLLPDEKKIFGILAKNPDGLTQSKLTLESGLGKVKISRVVKKLEDKGLIEKHKYGATNKLFLKE